MSIHSASPVFFTASNGVGSPTSESRKRTMMEKTPRRLKLHDEKTVMETKALQKHVFLDAEQCEGMRKTLEKLRFEAPKIMAYNHL